MNKLLLLFLLMITGSCKGQNNTMMNDNQPYLIWNSEDNQLVIKGADIITAFPDNIKAVLAYYTSRIPYTIEVNEPYLAGLLGNYTTLKQSQDTLLPQFNSPYSPDDIIDILYYAKSDDKIGFWWRGGAHVFKLDSTEKITRSASISSGRDNFGTDTAYIQNLFDVLKPYVPYGKEALCERWTEPDNPENYIFWGLEGSLSFSQTNQQKTKSVFGIGSYIYQSATGELFGQITSVTERQAVDDKADYPLPVNMYYRILEKTDTTIRIQTVTDGYEYSWGQGSDSLYRLKFEVEIDHLPLTIKEFIRRKEGIPYDVEGLLERLNGRASNESGRMEIDAYEHPELYPNFIVSGETNAFIGICKQYLNELGAEAVWNRDKQVYELKKWY